MGGWMTCIAPGSPLFPLQTCDDMGAPLSLFRRLLFHLTGTMFMDCMINWKELTWEIGKPCG